MTGSRKNGTRPLERSLLDGYGLAMSESVYNVIELIGTSAESWEKATANAVSEAARTLRDLRVARVIEQDVLVEEGEVVLFRSKVRLSFKHENEFG